MMKGTIQSKKTFRYFTLGNLTSAKKLLYVLHGYGQSPAYFIKKFENLSGDYFIVAPEGMHRFYLKGSSGRVGASWMTKEEREDDIQDTLNFLNRLDSEFNQHFSPQQKTILGFSQGGATAARWFYKNTTIASELVIWASVFPPDLAIENEIFSNDLKEKHFVIGTEDEFFTPEDQHEIETFYTSKGFKTHIYQGKHDIDSKTLETILLNNDI